MRSTSIDNWFSDMMLIGGGCNDDDSRPAPPDHQVDYGGDDDDDDDAAAAYAGEPSRIVNLRRELMDEGLVLLDDGDEETTPLGDAAFDAGGVDWEGQIEPDLGSGSMRAMKFMMPMMSTSAKVAPQRSLGTEMKKRMRYQSGLPGDDSTPFDDDAAWFWYTGSESGLVAAADDDDLEAPLAVEEESLIILKERMTLTQQRLAAMKQRMAAEQRRLAVVEERLMLVERCRRTGSGIITPTGLAGRA
ncbi:MAG: hypothetical protein M1827_006950 [Pycnora praestabilis]|nr:MAG: hypothetical protein M1827_006950 [Pycnora praestabilis]